MCNNGKESDGLLSVVIPYYNGYDFIFKMIADLLRIRQLKEIIIVDDGSPDNRTDDLKEAFKEEKKIAVYRKENGGIADARNFGMGLTTGEYILFVDQDDKVVPETMDEAVKVLHEQNCNCALWSTNKVLNEEKTKPVCCVKTSGKVEQRIIYNEFIRTFLFFEPNEWITFAGHVWGGLFRTSFLVKNKIGFNRFVNYEDDYLFMLLVLLNSDSICLIKEIGYYWNVHETSYSHKQHYISDLQSKQERLVSYICKELRDYKISEEIICKFELKHMQEIPIKDIYNRCINHETLINIYHATKILMMKDRNKYKYNCPCAQDSRYYIVAYYLLRYRMCFGAVLLCKYMYHKNKRIRKSKLE